MGGKGFFFAVKLHAKGIPLFGNKRGNYHRFKDHKENTLSSRFFLLYRKECKD